MKNYINSRRQFIKETAAITGFVSLPSLLKAQNQKGAEMKKIVCVGGHPDDPESGCGGTLARLVNAGHEVTVIYLTKGETGIPGKSREEAGAIREKEAINACRILKAKPVFAGQINGSSVVDNESINKMKQLITDEKPDIVFTHWPVDAHKDHQAASFLTIQTWMLTPQKFVLSFYEVCAGEQTIVFHPTDYVDITDTQEQKRQAVFCHVSQDPPGIYSCGHAAMEDFRGRELGVKAGEAFIRMNGRTQGGFMTDRV